MQFKAHETNINYDEFGINLNKLGCVMLDLQLDTLAEEIAEEHGFTPYTPNDPDRFWIDGITKDHHVTLRYGLLPNVRQKHVWDALASVGPIGQPESRTMFTGNLDYFPGYNNQYFVMIIRIYMDDQFGQYVMDCHNALGLLPNVQTFSPPEFHITLGYFTGDPTPLKRFNRLTLITAETRGIRCGRNMYP